MKKTFLTLAVITGVLAGGMAPAQAGVLEFFFPMLRQKGPDPMDTLKAPFALDPTVPAPAVKPDPKKAALADNLVPLDKPHRSNDDIVEWITTAASDALLLDKNYQQNLKNFDRYFTPEAKQQYVTFLTEKNVIKALDTGQYQIRSFVRSQPLLLNEGAVNGSYRWLYEVPMMVTYLQNGAKDYKTAKPVNQNFVLTIQVGRTTTAGNGPGILIERWDGKVATK